MKKKKQVGQWWIKGALLIGICLNGMPACSNVKPAVSAQDDAALQMMVVDRSHFEVSHKKPCSHTRMCPAPLVCENGMCEIPPSITGRADERTPQVSFETDKGKFKIWLEVVDDDYTMQRGMMMRRGCQPGWGMLFVYPSEGMRSFWMHNTYMSLDMVFIRRDGSVSNVIENAEPLNDVPRYESTDRVMFVIELPGGSAAEYGIRSGSRFDMSDFR
ncbi:MAG: DUF192 domain-containing protein [Proteobacteria bacterium]|nr:DUF192 domain-containing protein [Pseudomonadota bacterium]